MKASNILLTAIFSFIFLASIGSNLILKNEYDKIDRTDRFSEYDKEALKPFKYVKLQGKAIGLTAIQQGTSYEMRIIVDHKYLSWKNVGDTLEVTYKRDWNGAKIGPDRLSESTPSIYIMAPKISGVTSVENNYLLKGWKNSDISLHQNNGVIMLSDNYLNNLTARLYSESYLRIDGSNKINNSNIEVRDSSTLHVEKNIFKSFHTSFDSSAVITLPGSLIKPAVGI